VSIRCVYLCVFIVFRQKGRERGEGKAGGVQGGIKTFVIGSRAIRFLTSHDVAEELGPERGHLGCKQKGGVRSLSRSGAGSVRLCAGLVGWSYAYVLG
jgi:hypothetical protein